MTSLRGSTEVTISERASARFSNAASRYSGAVDTLEAERTLAKPKAKRAKESATCAAPEGRDSRLRAELRSLQLDSHRRYQVAGYLYVDREPPLTLRYSRFMVRQRVTTGWLTGYASDR